MENIKKNIRSAFAFEQMPLFVALVIICIFFSIQTSMFMSFRNWMNILRAASLVGITSIGMVILLLTGEVDLSVGSVVAFSGVTGVVVMNISNSFVAGLIAALIIGLIIGLMNATFVIFGKINSFVATLGSMAIVRGAIMVITQARSVQAENIDFVEFGAGYWWVFPKPLIIMLFLFAIFIFILNSTAYGRYVYAVGGNIKAAELAGLPVNKIKYSAFIIVAVLAALTGYIIASRASSGQPTAGTGWEFQVIAAVILGGVSLNGGRGTLFGAMLGVLIISVLQNGLILMNVSSFWHEIIRGTVIVLAVFFDTLRKRSIENKLIKSRNQ